MFRDLTSVDSEANDRATELLIMRPEHFGISQQQSRQIGAPMSQTARAAHSCCRVEPQRRSRVQFQVQAAVCQQYR
jgi:hypothetical protein